MIELKTRTITSKIEIDHKDNDLFGLRSLHKHRHPLSKARLLDLVNLGALPPEALSGTVIVNNHNGCHAKLVIRYGRYSAKLPRKLKKRLMPLSIREALGYGWRDLCRLHFTSMIERYVSAKIDADMSSAIEQLMQEEDKWFLSLCEKATTSPWSCRRCHEMMRTSI